MATVNDQVCAGTKVNFGELPVTIDGVVITAVSSTTVHFDIPVGAVVEVCVKAGLAEQGEGPEFLTLTADANVSPLSALFLLSGTALLRFARRFDDS